ncbi:MAG TPA: threonine synthase, partial [bacterium]|nr:threonine synthase [bacterium]
LTNLYFKDDGRNPSASFKDRAGAVALLNAIENNAEIITGASTGNAASSMACLSASLGISPVIFVPKAAPIAKISQLLVFGAQVYAVNGTYYDAFDLCLKVTEKFGWYNRNTGFNPYTREGKKTCALEIIEQLNWKVPDKVFVPVGDGNIISGIWKGFKDFYELGLIEKLPQLIAVQAEGSAAISNAINKNTKVIEAVKANTIADSISVDIPRDGELAVKSVLESQGGAVTVSDNEILSAIKEVARLTGIFGEPAGVTGYAGLKKLLNANKLKESEKIVIVVTGNGLKDVASAQKSVGQPYQIEADIDSFLKVYNKK